MSNNSRAKFEDGFRVFRTAEDGEYVYESEHARRGTEGVYRVRVSERAMVKANAAGIGLRGRSNRPGAGSELNGHPRGTSTSRGRRVCREDRCIRRVVVVVVAVSSSRDRSARRFHSHTRSSTHRESAEEKQTRAVTPVKNAGYAGGLPRMRVHEHDGNPP